MSYTSSAANTVSELILCSLLAIMLGRLRMTLSEAQNAYLNFSKTIFTPKHHSLNPYRGYDFLKGTGKFESEPLNKHIKALLEERHLPDDELLRERDRERDSDPESCKVSARLTVDLIM